MAITFERVAALVAFGGACIGIFINLQNARNVASKNHAEQIEKTVSMQITLKGISEDLKVIKASFIEIEKRLLRLENKAGD